jgi:hypothetical protein
MIYHPFGHVFWGGFVLGSGLSNLIWCGLKMWGVL